MADTPYTRIHDCLVLGSSRYTAQDLNALGIGAVVCVAPSDEAAEPTQFAGPFYRFPIAFTIPETMAHRHAAMAARTVHALMSEGVVVYLHCLEGNNRSAAVAVAVLAHASNIPTETVTSQIASKRLIFPRSHWIESAFAALDSHAF
jgi:hypothetical protein